MFGDSTCVHTAAFRVTRRAQHEAFYDCTYTMEFPCLEYFPKRKVSTTGRTEHEADEGASVTCDEERVTSDEERAGVRCEGKGASARCDEAEWNWANHWSGMKGRRRRETRYSIFHDRSAFVATA